MTIGTGHGPTFSLSSAKQGDFVRVIDIKAGKLLKKRLVSMGVLINSRLHIIQHRGNALVGAKQAAVERAAKVAGIGWRRSGTTLGSENRIRSMEFCGASP